VDVGRKCMVLGEMKQQSSENDQRRILYYCPPGFVRATNPRRMACGLSGLHKQACMLINRQHHTLWLRAKSTDYETLQRVRIRNCFWNYMNPIRHWVGILRWGISPSISLYLHSSLQHITDTFMSSVVCKPKIPVLEWLRPTSRTAQSLRSAVIIRLCTCRKITYFHSVQMPVHQRKTIF
jgi:hypothetical protein